MDNNSLEEALVGVLHLHSETGTEGGYWAFQDSLFIFPNTTHYSCKKCGLYAYKEKNNTSAPPVFKQPSIIGIHDYCSPDEHQFELTCEKHWPYEGLHILRDGDQLTIYHPDNNNVVWSGVIALKQHPLFTEDANGYWIHADQIGIERKIWAEYFFKEYPARLVPSKKP